MDQQDVTCLVESFCSLGENLMAFLKEKFQDDIPNCNYDLCSSMEQFFEYVVLLEDCIPQSVQGELQVVSTSVREILAILQEDESRRLRQVVMGRPALIIEEDRLQFFVDNGFKVEDMAILCGVSKRTIERRLQLYQLSTRKYTVIVDSELDEIVQVLSHGLGKKL